MTMTRSNLYITLSDGSKILAVADSSSTPEQGYIVESFLQPLLMLSDAKKERALIEEHCCMNELRLNATYSYFIDLPYKQVRFFEERYHAASDTFTQTKDLTHRYEAYLKKVGVKITDSNGKEIPVIDIDGSITAVTEFLSYRNQSEYASLERLETQRVAYWQDIYEKLQQLKAQLNKLQHDKE